MYCWVRYRNPANGCEYYFVKYRSDGITPVGSLPCLLRRGKAKRFVTKRDAKVVANHLSSLGYPSIIKSR